MDSSDESNKSFFKHVFNFDDDSKSEILNTLQYILLAIIPVVILTKTIGKYVPDADDKKGNRGSFQQNYFMRGVFVKCTLGSSYTERLS